MIRTIAKVSSKGRVVNQENSGNAGLCEAEAEGAA